MRSYRRCPKKAVAESEGIRAKKNSPSNLPFRFATAFEPYQESSFEKLLGGGMKTLKGKRSTKISVGHPTLSGIIFRALNGYPTLNI
jgi:hypothetical protein